jgi:hypothetical protein
VVVRNVSLWNSLILGWVVIAYPFMPKRHNYWMFEHNHVPLCSIVYSDEVANLFASVSSFFILSVAYIIGDVTLSCFLAGKE